MPQPFGRAVVIGGSMAGLAAARVLADHFERVTIVDRDQFPEGPSGRKGVPQARHLHVLLTRGFRFLTARFPELGDQLARAGAPIAEWGYDTRVSNFGLWMPRVRSGLRTPICSRDLLEFQVRQALFRFPNVELKQEQEAIGLLTSANSDRVLGVRTRSRLVSPSAAAEGTLEADLVVDASGRGSRAPEWLAELGYEAPGETTINPFLRYTSRLYTPPAGFQADWKSLLIRGIGPLVHRGGIIFQIEGGRWLVTLAGSNRDYPPLDNDGFLEFARSLGEPPELYEALREAEPLTDPVGYQRTENRWRHYETARRWPERFVILGDAVCAFNPVYGQGMTSATMQADALDQCLQASRAKQDGLTGMPLQFQRSIARILKLPWTMATNEDFRGEATEGPRPGRAIRAIYAYLDKLAVCSAHHPSVYRRYIEVMQLTRPPSILFHPAVAARVLATSGPVAGRGR